MAIDLEKCSQAVDEALANETTESVDAFLAANPDYSGEISVKEYFTIESCNNPANKFETFRWTGYDYPTFDKAKEAVDEYRSRRETKVLFPNRVYRIIRKTTETETYTY